MVKEEMGAMPAEGRLSLDELSKVDPRRIYRVYEAWPDYAEEASKISVDLGRKNYGRVIYLGLGGSATAGDIISDWMISAGGVEVSVFRDEVPRGRLDDALVIACSTSGQTEETLALAEKVWARGPRGMVAVSTGGRLEEFAERNGIAFVKIRLAESPRYTLPFSLFASISALRGASLLDGLEQEIDETISTLKTTARTIGTSSAHGENPAKQLADVVTRGEPCIYGSSNTRSIVRRFKTALNENAKMHAFCDYSPELFHNEVEAWERPEGGLCPIFIRRTKEPPFEAKSLDIFASMLEGRGVPTHLVRGAGDGNLAQLMCLCYITDFASYYAAVLRGVDPFPVNLIDHLKKSR